MSKKDYESAARIIQTVAADATAVGQRTIVLSAFVNFFRNDNPDFDEARFRRACQPGANVKARGR